MKFRWDKYFPIWKKCEKNFISDKNPTSSWKSGVFWVKKIKIPIGSGPFFEGSLILLKIGSYEVQVDLFFPYFEKKCGKIFKGKKIQLQVSKSGVFSKKKSSANCLKLRSYIVHKEVIHGILPKNFKKNFKWTKIQL